MSHHEDYQLKDTNPLLGERWPAGGAPGGGVNGWLSSDKFTSTYDLVEQMCYLYVRVVKAKDLPTNPITMSCDPFVEVKLGNYKGSTTRLDKKINPEWNQVFAFSKDRIQSSTLEVFVKDKEMVSRDDYVGRVVFDLNEVPTRVPPDSPLAPQWYRLEELRGERKVRGEIMLAVWIGTQADEAFPEAWHSDAASVHGEGVANIRSKVYVSPKLWYLRVNVIEAQDVQPNARGRTPEVFVKAQVGNQVLKTKICSATTLNPLWNEDLIFVVAEPFEEQLILAVEDRVSPRKDDVLGRVSLQLALFEKRLDHRPFVQSRWFDLEKFGFGVLEGETRRELRFASRIHLRVCLEGAYHVMDESTMYISDQRPTARQLWKQPIGILEVGILGAKGLLPMKMKDGQGTTDAYCVAKYGQKWVRTRTMVGTFSPNWNEQYTWEVFDPCTVITMGVFDNCHLGGGGPSRSAPAVGVEEDGGASAGGALHLPLAAKHGLSLRPPAAAQDALPAPLHREPAGQPEVPGDEHRRGEAGPGRAAAEEGGGGVHAGRGVSHVEHEEEQGQLLQDHGAALGYDWPVQMVRRCPPLEEPNHDGARPCAAADTDRLPGADSSHGVSLHVPHWAMEL